MRAQQEINNTSSTQVLKRQMANKAARLDSLKKNKTIIELKELTKYFADNEVLKSIDLKIHEGEFVTFLGPSGSGKTTTLNLIGGFEYPTRGEININGYDVKDLPPHKRPTSTIFQDYALFRHLDVKGNIAYGLKLVRVPVQEKIDRNKERLAQAQVKWNKVATEKMTKLDKEQAEYSAKLSAHNPDPQELAELKKTYNNKAKLTTDDDAKKRLIKEFYRAVQGLRLKQVPDRERAKLQKWWDDSDFKYSYWENYVNLKTEEFKKRHTTRGLTAKEIDDKVNQMLAMVGLEKSKNSNILSLSGGMKQRVTLARSLAISPKILLLDEPLSALDAKIRTQMQRLLVEIQEELGLTFVFVTHDQKEALELSTRIVVMRDGKIEQFDSPEQIYDYPINKWVANFIGESNFFEGIYLGNGQASVMGKSFPTIHNDEQFKINQIVDALIRPEDIQLSKTSGHFEAEVVDWTYKGSYYITEVEVQGKLIFTESTDFFEVGSKVYLNWDIDDIHLMTLEADTKSGNVSLAGANVN